MYFHIICGDMFCVPHTHGLCQVLCSLAHIRHTSRKKQKLYKTLYFIEVFYIPFKSYSSIRTRTYVQVFASLVIVVEKFPRMAYGLVTANKNCSH